MIMKKFFLTLSCILMAICANSQTNEIQYYDFESDPIVVDEAYTMANEGYVIDFGNYDLAIQNYGQNTSYVACFGQTGVMATTHSVVNYVITPLDEGALINGQSMVADPNNAGYFFPALYDPQQYTLWAGQTKYVGFKAIMNNVPHYGWIKLKVDVSQGANNPVIYVYGYAYNKIPSAPILAGAKVSTPSSLSDNQKMDISIYPNPTTDQLFVTGSDQIDDISIYDLNGKQMIYTNNVNNTISLLSLEKGTYFVKVNYGGDTMIKKIVKL